MALDEANEKADNKDVKITEEKDDKMKVLVFNVEEMDPALNIKEQEAPL